jgi:hypothetical protein
VDDLLDIKTMNPEKKRKRRKKKKTDEKRTSSGIKKKPERYADIERERWWKIKSVYYEASEPGSNGGTRALARYSESLTKVASK